MLSCFEFAFCCGDPEKWVFEPDNTPLPSEVTQAIQKFYEHNKLKMNKPTQAKIVRFINYIRAKGGEARLSVKSFEEDGLFESCRPPAHQELGENETHCHRGLLSRAHISKLYRFTDRMLEMFPKDGR